MNKINILNGIEDYIQCNIDTQSQTLAEYLRQYLERKMQLSTQHLQAEKQQRHTTETELNDALHRPVAMWQQIMDVEQHLQHAIALFEQQAFIVLLDDRQILHVDEPLQWMPYSQLQFIRLVALTGKVKT